MKIAIPYEAGQVFQHFGHSPAFMVYEVEAGKVVSSALLPTNGSGHGALAGLLAANQVNALVCGRRHRRRRPHRAGRGGHRSVCRGHRQRRRCRCRAGFWKPDL